MTALAVLGMSAALPPSIAKADTVLAQAGGLKRGDRLPDAYRGQVVSDYERYRLRRPPSGYAWYRAGNQFVLASIATGVIFDIVDVDG